MEPCPDTYLGFEPFLSLDLVLLAVFGLLREYILVSMIKEELLLMCFLFLCDFITSAVESALAVSKAADKSWESLVSPG